MESSWLSWAKRLQAIASTGLHFTKDEFDRERYLEVAGLANQMLAELADRPVERIENLVPDFAKGYVTPRVDVRGAVIRGDRVLLVRERNGLWSLPGGFADVGHSPAENIVKEVREEAGIDVVATRLYSVRHKAKHPYDPDVRDFYKFFFLCGADDGQAPVAGHETLAADFFSRDELPALSRSRVIEADIVSAFAFRDAPGTPTIFD